MNEYISISLHLGDWEEVLGNLEEFGKENEIYREIQRRIMPSLIKKTMIELIHESFNKAMVKADPSGQMLDNVELDIKLDAVRTNMVDRIETIDFGDMFRI